jgi:hypothetical protein
MKNSKKPEIFSGDDRRLVAAGKLPQLARLERDLDDRSERLLGVEGRRGLAVRGVLLDVTVF